MARRCRAPPRAASARRAGSRVGGFPLVRRGRAVRVTRRRGSLVGGERREQREAARRRRRARIRARDPVRRRRRACSFDRRAVRRRALRALRRRSRLFPGVGEGDTAARTRARRRWHRRRGRFVRVGVERRGRSERRRKSARTRFSPPRLMLFFSPRRRFARRRRPSRRRREARLPSLLRRRRSGRPRHGHGPLPRGRRRGVLGVARAIRDELALGGELGQKVALVPRQARVSVGGPAGTPLRASANHRGGRVGAGAGRVRRRLLARSKSGARKKGTRVSQSEGRDLAGEAVACLRRVPDLRREEG